MQKLYKESSTEQDNNWDSNYIDQKTPRQLQAQVGYL